MKAWFKYEYGYVNIDAQHLYFTNTGNWSETKKLSENSKKVKLDNNFKQFKFIGFILIVIGFLSFQILDNVINNTVAIGLLVSITALGYKLYNYFKSEIGGSYKIPLKKIQELILNENSISITYINGEDVKSYQEIVQIEEKAIPIIKELKTLLKI
jgi:hypothetical protein